MTNKIPFSIQQTTFLRYLRWTNIVGWVILWLTFYGLFAFVVLIDDDFAARWLGIHAVWMSIGMLLTVLYTLWYTEKYVGGLSYELVGDTLYINQGVFTLQRKAIPLDRVTDIIMTQGVIMRRMGLWQIDVQTAGMGGMTGAEGTMYAIDAPKHVRDTLLNARKRLVVG